MKALLDGNASTCWSASGQGDTVQLEFDVIELTPETTMAAEVTLHVTGLTCASITVFNSVGTDSNRLQSKHCSRQSTTKPQSCV